jgi:hypothetical protein
VGELYTVGELYIAGELCGSGQAGLGIYIFPRVLASARTIATTAKALLQHSSVFGARLGIPMRRPIGTAGPNTRICGKTNCASITYFQLHLFTLKQRSIFATFASL